MREAGHIDWMFSNAVMPHISGKELAERVRGLHPLAKILLTSACPDNAIIHQTAFQEGVTLLQKPFSPAALAHKVREVLDQPSNRAPLLPATVRCPPYFPRRSGSRLGNLQLDAGVV